MKDSLFVQFYSEYGENAYAVYNGFSDAYYICKNKGDFLWVNENEADTIDLPKGTIYVSAYFLKHMVYIFNWAEKFRDTKFIIGGPSVLTNYNYDLTNYPNIQLVKSSVEEFFNKPNFSSSWNLDTTEIKEILNTKETLLFSYTLDTSCYWNKCIFCNYYFTENRKRKNIDLTAIKKIDFNGIKQVRLNSPGVTPPMAKLLFSNIKHDSSIVYDFLMRCNKGEHRTLKKILENFSGDIPNIKIRLGVEFPSDRMLKFINKGFSVDDILTTLNILKDYESIKIFTMYMIGWPNLIESDKKALENYVNTIPKLNTVAIFRTFFSVNTPLYDMYINKDVNHRYEKDFHKGYFLNLNDSEMKINQECGELMKQIPCENLFIHAKDFIGE